MRVVLAMVFAAAAALAQTSADAVDRVFHFTNIETPMGRRELANAIRSVADIQRVSVDNTAGVLAIHAMPWQASLAEWVFSEVDRPAGAVLIAGSAQVAPVVREYRVPGDYVPMVRVYFLAHAVTPQAIQELINSIRSIAEVQRVVAFSAQAAIMTRGTLDQAALTDWMVKQLDQPGGASVGKGPLEYSFPAERDSGAVRVYHLAHATTPQAAQELVNAVRSVAELERATVYNTNATMIVRGRPVQAALADWLVQELDRPAEARTVPSIDEYTGAPVDASSGVRVVRPAHADTPQAMQEVVNMVRTIAGMQRVVANMGSRAMVMRGTQSQLATAEKLVKEASGQ
jgi:hypothetical protein